MGDDLGALGDFDNVYGWDELGGDVGQIQRDISEIKDALGNLGSVEERVARIADEVALARRELWSVLSLIAFLMAVGLARLFHLV